MSSVENWLAFDFYTNDKWPVNETSPESHSVSHSMTAGSVIILRNHKKNLNDQIGAKPIMLYSQTVLFITIKKFLYFYQVFLRRYICISWFNMPFFFFGSLLFLSHYLFLFFEMFFFSFGNAILEVLKNIADIQGFNRNI